MTALAVAFWPGFGGFLAGAICVWLHGSRVRAELSRTRWTAEHDALTGVANRAGIRRCYDQLQRAKRPTAMVLLDLDGFKQVNDSWGHETGDRLLAEVGQRLARMCEPFGVAGRLGGDEFLILLPQSAQADVATAAARILAGIAKSFVVTDTALPGGVTLTPAASAGIATGGPESTWSLQLRQADIALYHAKVHPHRAVTYELGMRQPQKSPTASVTPAQPR